MQCLILYLFACRLAVDSEGAPRLEGETSDSGDRESRDSGVDRDSAQDLDSDVPSDTGAVSDTEGEADSEGESDSGPATDTGADSDSDADTDVAPDSGPVDEDGDGYAVGDDCDDTDATISPAAAEVCEDGWDNDCADGDAWCRASGTSSLGSVLAKVYSDQAGFDAGRHVDAGDIDGDGLDDLIVATKQADGNQGGAYVVYGPVAGTDTLDSLGFRIEGDASTTSAGRSIAVGDIDGDGVEDVGIGAPDDTCRAWVVFGPVTGDMNLVDAAVTFVGEAGTESGHAMDLADVDGDGVGDAIIGAYEDDLGGTDAGTVFIQYGPLVRGTVSLPTAMDSRLVGENDYAMAGRYLRAGFDVDGDGIGDILAAAPYAAGMASGAGAAYLVLGGLRGDVDLAAADAKFLGESADDNAGEGLTMGDVDGDGLGDIVLGSYNSAGGDDAGAAYVVLGPRSGPVDLASADFIVRGTSARQYVGIGLAVGDTDGDGAGELVIGAPGDGAASVGAGAAYLFYGPPSGTLTLADASAVWQGEAAYHGAGESLVFGDFDGDARLDLLLGAPGEYTGGAEGGAVYVIAP